MDWLEVDAREDGRQTPVLDIEAEIPAGVQVGGEVGHVEVVAILVEAHVDVIAAPLELLGGAHDDGLTGPAILPLPAGAPVVHEVVRDAPFRGGPQ